MLPIAKFLFLLFNTHIVNGEIMQKRLWTLPIKYRIDESGFYNFLFAF